MKYIALVLLTFFILSCSQREADLENLSGDEKSKRVAARMIEKLGGLEKWKSLSKIQIEYQVNEGENIYRSIEKLNLDTKEMTTTYINDNVNLVRNLKGDSAWVINNGKKLPLDQTNTSFLKYWYNLNYYNKLHELVTNNVFVRYTDQNHLMVMSLDKQEYLFGFSLNADFSPEKFYRPKFNGQNISLKLSDWRDHNGYLIPFKGRAVEGDYEYRLTEFSKIK